MKSSRISGWLHYGILAGILSMGVVATSHGGELSDGLGGVPVAEIMDELQAVPAGVRSLMTREQMTRFIANVLIDRRMAKAAAASGVPERPEVQAGIARAIRSVVVRAFVEEESAKIAATLPALENLARERYQVNRATYATQEAIRVAHILFKVNEEDPQASDAAMKAQAENVLAQLKSGGDFGALAREHSQDHGSARSQGELPGWFERGRFVPPFEEAAYSLKPGELSGAVRSRFGYHIIKPLEFRAAGQRSFEEVKESIISTLRSEFLETRRAEWMKQFQGTQQIELDDALLQVLKNSN